MQGPSVGGQVGQVALQRRPVEAGQAGDVDRWGLQEAGQAGHRLNVDVGLDGAAADAQPPAGEPFRRPAQPGLRDGVEPQPFATLDPEPAQLPHIPRELGPPSAATVQILLAAVGVAQERQLPVLAVLGGVVGVEVLDPARHRPIQQRGHPARGRERNDRARDAGMGFDPPFVVAALQRVLQLQLELRALNERAEVEPIVAVGLTEHGKLVDVGTAHARPARPVVDTEPRARLCPQCAVGQRAGRVAGVVHRGKAAQPCRAVRLAGPFPEPVVAHAQTPAGAAVTAARHDADRKLLAPEPFRGRRRGERLDVGSAFLLPLVVVALAKPTGARLADAARHRARHGVEHQRPTLGDQDVRPELGADGAHERAQQPRRRARRARRLRRGHQRTSCPVRKPAASSARRASSTDRCNGDVRYSNCRNAPAGVRFVG